MFLKFKTYIIERLSEKKFWSITFPILIVLLTMTINKQYKDKATARSSMTPVVIEEVINEPRTKPYIHININGGKHYHSIEGWYVADSKFYKGKQGACKTLISYDNDNNRHESKCFHKITFIKVMTPGLLKFEGQQGAYITLFYFNEERGFIFDN